MNKKIDTNNMRDRYVITFFISNNYLIYLITLPNIIGSYIKLSDN